jgi:DNA-binding GntR family transcriptional regulator
MSSTVTQTIEQDLARQIKTRKTLPFKLTLGAIAKHYTVSLTPIRQVVEELIGQDILLRKPNGRLERTAPPTVDYDHNQGEFAERPINLNSDLDQLLTNDIVQLSLLNHEQYLREEATAKKYNTGRTVMRQVLSRLAGVGMIEHVPRCGWKVRTFREKDMLDYLQTRELLELKALSLARPRFVKSELLQLLNGNVAGDITSSSQLDNDLHAYWIDRCDNWYIQDFFQRHGAFFTALFDFAALGDEIKAVMAQEHRDILECLLIDDWQGAEQALIKHIQDQVKNVLKLMSKSF